MKPMSEQNVKEKFQKLYPDKSKRKIVVNILAEGIKAASHTMENWCLQFEGAPHLVVGHYFVLTLWRPEAIWLALSNDYQEDPGSLKIDHQLKDAGWVMDSTGTKAGYPHYKGRGSVVLSNNGVYTFKTEEMHKSNWKIIGPHFQKLIERVNAEGHRMDPRSPKRHQPAFVEYICKESGLDLPDIMI